MANIKLLQEAIQAFANGEDALADKKMRKYFVEAAQEINKQLEEEMEEELDEATEECEEEEVIEEDFNTAPDQSLNGEIQYALDEADEVETDVDAEAESFDDADDKVDVDVDSETETESEVESDDVPTGDEWASIKDAFAGLSQMFQDISGEGEDIDFDDSESEDGVDMDIDVDADGEDEYADVDFGEKQFGESFQLKKVGEVDKKEKAGVHDKSPVAKNAKSPVDGVAPVKIKDGTVVTNDGDLLKNKDAETAKVEDHNNVMDNGKNVMKPAKTPKNTAEKSRSPIPKNAPKF